MNQNIIMVINEEFRLLLNKKKTNRNGEIKMTNENLNVANDAVEEAPKRKRKAPVKVQKTAVQIGEELHKLQEEVSELEQALAGLSQDNVAYNIVAQAHTTKLAELDAALNHVYTA